MLVSIFRNAKGTGANPPAYIQHKQALIIPLPSLQETSTDPYWYDVSLLFVTWHLEPEEGSTDDFWQVEDAAPLDQLVGEDLQPDET